MVEQKAGILSSVASRCPSLRVADMSTSPGEQIEGDCFPPLVQFSCPVSLFTESMLQFVSTLRSLQVTGDMRDYPHAVPIVCRFENLTNLIVYDFFSFGDAMLFPHLEALTTRVCNDTAQWEEFVAYHTKLSSLTLKSLPRGDVLARCTMLTSVVSVSINATCNSVSCPDFVVALIAASDTLQQFTALPCVTNDIAEGKHGRSS